MSISNGVHETSTTSGTGPLTLVASGVQGELRVSERHDVGQTVQYVAISQSSAKMEEGEGVVGASNTLTRTDPQFQHNGTVIVPNPSAPLDFGGETVDVYITPTSTGLLTSSNLLASALSDHSVLQDLFFSAHIVTGTRSSATQAANTVYSDIYWKLGNNKVSGIAFYNGSSMAGQKCRVAIHERAPDGGLGANIAETTDFAPTATGAYVEKAFASPIEMPPGFYIVSFIADFASNVHRFGSNSSMRLLGLRDNNVSSYSALQDSGHTGWSTVPDLPAVGSLLSSVNPTILLRYV